MARLSPVVAGMLLFANVSPPDRGGGAGITVFQKHLKIPAESGSENPCSWFSFNTLIYP